MLGEFLLSGRGEVVGDGLLALVPLEGKVGAAAADDGTDEVHEALEHCDEHAAPPTGRGDGASRAGGICKVVVNVPVVVVVVPPAIVVPGAEVRRGRGPAVVAVRAEVAKAAGARVVAEAVVRPLARVVAVDELVARLGPAAVRAVRALVADRREELVVAVVVVAVAVVVVVVAVEPAVVVVPPVPAGATAVVAHAVEGPFARVIAVVVVQVRLDLRDHHSVAGHDDLSSSRVYLGHVDVDGLALLHLGPLLTLQELEDNLRRVEGVHLVCRGFGRAQGEHRAVEGEPRAAHNKLARVRGEHDALALLDLRVLEDLRNLEALAAGSNGDNSICARFHSAHQERSTLGAPLLALLQ
mmetsp:Transcript_4087/g.12029  ORF Transcript_4087/g.12029 Transcript_4087/m.12029 type:complete len:355 (-) Transcript_4087:1568-2632(-)